MKQILIYKIIIGILVFLNIYLGYQLVLHNQISRENNIDLEEKVINISIINNQLNDFIKMQYQLEGKWTEEFFQEKYGHWKDENHVIVFFNESHCKSCIKEIVLDFSLIKQKTSFDKFVLMGSFNEEKDFYSYVDQIDYEFSHEYVSKEYHMFGEVEFPVVFVVDESLNIRLFYVPDLLPKLRRQYFYTILTEYLEQIEAL